MWIVAPNEQQTFLIHHVIHSAVSKNLLYINSIHLNKLPFVEAADYSCFH